MGSSSLTRDQTRALCIESMESQALDHQGSPMGYLLSSPHTGCKECRAGVFFFSFNITLNHLQFFVVALLHLFFKVVVKYIKHKIYHIHNFTVQWR